jgi:hypothetical protein
VQLLDWANPLNVGDRKPFETFSHEEIELGGSRKYTKFF